MENNNGCVPKLRFPGFTGNWEKKKLGEIIKLSKGSQINGTELNNNSRYPMMNGGSTRSGYYSDYNNEADTIIISEGGNSCGYVNYMTERFWAGGHCYVVSLLNDDVKGFVYQLLKAHENKIQALRVGSGLPNIQSKDLLNYEVLFCSAPAEQQKIADCLSEMDNQISDQAQKVESMKTHKRGLMQQLFPQPGETTPQLRFPGFTGKWEEKKLGGILIERKESSIITEELPQLSFTIAEGVIRPEDRKTNQRDFLMTDKDNKRFSVTRLHDIIYNPANVVYGAIHKNNLCDGVVSPIYKIFWTKENADFINYLLRRPEFISLLASRAEGTVTKLKTLKADAFLDMTVPFIVDPVEQKKIAECLSELDKNIEAELAKLESLKNHKKGLMQQLFPEPIK